MTEIANLITGTGRCGSTILSRMLMNHPDACVLREFLALLDFRKMTYLEVSGEGLATILCGDLHPVILFLQRGGTMQEILYKLTEAEKKQARWRKPGLLLAPLPYLTDEPEKLFEEIIDWAKKQPKAPMSVHYPRLFKLIAEKTGRKVPIEASATGNLDLGIFPNPRVLHIHRSGPEVVLSMCAHPYFRMMAALLNNPLSTKEIAVAVECSEPEKSDPVLSRMDVEDKELIPTLTLLWSTVLAQNYYQIRKVPIENVMEVNFEELAKDPRSHLIKMAEFFELPDRGDAWLDEASKLLSPVKERLPEADQETQEYLNKMCWSLQVVMGRITLRFDNDLVAQQMFKAHGRKILPLK